MSNLRQAAQQALEEMLRVNSAGIFEGELNEAITALRATLAEPEQEPVAYCTLEQLAALKLVVPSSDKIALYIAPTPCKPLTDEEIDRVTDQQWGQNNHKPIYAAHRAYARAIEAKLMEKNA